MTPDERNDKHRQNDSGRPRSRYNDRYGGSRGYRSGDNKGDRNGPEERRRPYNASKEERGDRPRGRYDDRGNRGDNARPGDGRRCRNTSERDGNNRFRGKRSGDRPRGRYDDRGNGRNRRYDDGRRRGRYNDEPEDRPKITVPSDVTEILHKGIDCEMNGRSDLAQILYLHGAAKLNGGCEKRLVGMLGEAGADQFPTIRGRVKKECPAELMPLFDYLCSTVAPGYDVSSVRPSAEDGNIIAIHCIIRMGGIEKEDGLIDVYAKSIYDKPEIVTEGLGILSRRLKSVKADKYLADYKDFLKNRQTIRPVFSRSLKGETSARKELNRLASLYPEAKFLEGYVMAVQEGKGEEYIRNGMGDRMEIILSYLQELRIPPSPFAKYLNAKKLQAKNDQWIPAMVGAVKDGSEDALRDLEPVSHWREVRKSLESYYLANNDIGNLVLAYDEKDSACLEKYCNGEVEKILDVGKRLGGTKEIDWLSKSYKKGCVECREALVEISKDWSRHCKPLLYALHDAGADTDAAKVYFDMQDDPSAPSVKWLSKVCRNEEAKEYIRTRFEETGDTQTFDYIMEDDGYVPKYMMKDKRPGNRRRY